MSKNNHKKFNKGYKPADVKPVNPTTNNNKEENTMSKNKNRKPATINNNTTNKEDSTMSKNRKNKAAVAAATVKDVTVNPVTATPDPYEVLLKKAMADMEAEKKAAAEKAAKEAAKKAAMDKALEELTRVTVANAATERDVTVNDNNTKALLALKRRIKTVYKEMLDNPDWKEEFEETVAIGMVWQAAFGDILNGGKVLPNTHYKVDINAAADEYLKEYISLHDVTDKNTELEAENKALKAELEALKAENAKLKAEAKKTPAPKADVKPAPTAKAKTPAPKADEKKTPAPTASKKDATVKPAPAPAPTAPKLPPMLKKGMSATVVKDYVDRVTASEKAGGLGWIEGRRYIKENYGVTAQKKDVLVVRLVEALNKEVQ